MGRKKTAKKGGRKATKKARKSKVKSASDGEMLLVASRTKEQLKTHGVNIAADALEGLNGWVHWLIEQAAKRTAANNRKTVRTHDFMIM